MKFSSLVERISEGSSSSWQVYQDALVRQEAGEDIIILSLGEEYDECAAEDIVDAAVTSLRSGRHHYTAINGNLDLRQAIAARHFERSGQKVDADQCAVFAGAQNALFAVAQCLLEKGDEVILSAPYYTTYPATFSAAGAEVVSVVSKPENNFQIDPNDIIAAITSRTRAIVLNSPNNPMGVVYTPEQYAAIVEACVQHQIWLINDDVYQELLLDSERTSPLGLPNADQVCITVSSLSKSHRMTGWRLGWVIARRELMTHLYDLSLCMSYGLPAFIQDAAIVALASKNKTALEIRAKLDRLRQVVLKQLTGVRGLKIHSVAGSMFVVLDVTEISIPADEFANGLLAKHDVAIIPCDGFGMHDANLLRMSLCVEEKRLIEACQRIVAYVNSLSGK